MRKRNTIKLETYIEGGKKQVIENITIETFDRGFVTEKVIKHKQSCRSNRANKNVRIQNKIQGQISKISNACLTRQQRNEIFKK